MAGTDEEGGAVATAEAVPGNGGPRSAGTRRAILEAARSAFAAHGYDQTTIRSVAATAGVDPSMVMRYFGSKAGLFTAASTTHLQPPDLSAVPAGQRGEALVRHIVERWDDAASRDELMLLMRTAVTSDAVAEQLQTVLREMIIGPVAALGASDADERGGFIATQLLGLALCRYILRQEPLASLPVARVVATVAPSVQRYLDE
jgi:AcrR family transcriptional regulator